MANGSRVNREVYARFCERLRVRFPGPTHLRQGFAPALRPGDVAILDNLATHKIRGVREAIEAVGARLLYLPPYSPDFNPIEPMWSKIKQILRSHSPRTEERLLRAAKIAFQSISAADCEGFFFSAPYAT